MDADSNSYKEKEPVNIGKIIESELRRQERTVTWLSRKIHCDRRNVYDIFSRTSIDTDLLYKISLALNTDFFAYFSTNLKQTVNQSITPHCKSLHNAGLLGVKYISHLCKELHHGGHIKKRYNNIKFAN